MDKIILEKKNHSIMHVGCDFGIAQELSDFFSFFVPGYKYMPAFRNKVWDGKIRLFNIQSNEIHVGLYPFIKEFADKRKYTIEFSDENNYGSPDDKDDINPKAIMDFIEGLEIESRGKPITVRDYQFNGICHALHNKRAVLVSPTGSGKSLIIYVLIKYYLSMLSSGIQKVLIVVPTTSLVDQMYNDFADYGMLVENGCHKIYSGKEKMTNAGVVISTWQSIYKLPGKWFEQFGCIVGDECHGFKSKSLNSIMNKSREAEYRWGTTGTLDGTQTHELVLQGLFGKTFNVTTTKKLQDNDTLAKLNISVIKLKYPEELRKNRGTQTYQEEIDLIVRNESRNKFIRNLATTQTGNTLVLFQFVEKHGKVLFDMIRDEAEGKVFYVSGETATADREAIRGIIETQKNAIIVASMGTFSTGINIRNLHNIVFASPSKSQIRVLQSIGRSLRKSDDGRDAKLFDIADDLHWLGRKNFALEHAAERIKIYNKQKFNFKVYEINLK
jgi:superfamily II DNA or RNA helicase